MVIAEKAAIGGEGRGVCALQHEMARAVDESAFLLRVAAPKYKDQSIALRGEAANDGIGKLFPAVPLVRPGLMGADGECGVEQQHALFRPAAQAAGGGHGAAQVVGYFLKDVLQRRGKSHTVGHREAQAFRLPLLVIRVLPEDYHLDLVERAKVEGIENLPPRRVAHALPVLRVHKVDELPEIRRGKLVAQPLVPTGFNFDGHGGKDFL